MMEGREVVLSKSPSRHKPLRRSLSAQPEESTLSSSPYSTRKRLGLPGRSLTEYFSHKQVRSTRAGSDDSQVTQRRTSVASSDSQLSPLTEDDATAVNLSFSESQLNLTPGFQVFAEYQRTIEYSAGNCNGESGLTLISNQRLPSEIVHDSDAPVTRPLRKKQKLAPLSSDEPVKKKHSAWWEVLQKLGKIIFCLLSVILSLILIVIGISTILVYQEALCEQKRNSALPMQKLKHQLSEHVVGQDVAVGILVKTLKLFVFSKVDVPMVLWLAGWTGSGKTLTANIIKNVLSNSSHIQAVVPSFLPRDKIGLRREADRLFHNLDPCALNLVIIDGWDEESNDALTILGNILLSIQNNHDKGSSKGRTLFILSGTRGSAGVNNHFLELHTTGKPREHFRPEDFTNLSAKIDEASIITSITKHHVLVPFLPFDAVQVKLCVERELHRIKRPELLTEEKLGRITEKVLSHLEFLPLSSLVFSSSGCKRVYSLLTIFLADPYYSLAS